MADDDTLPPSSDAPRDDEPSLPGYADLRLTARSYGSYVYLARDLTLGREVLVRVVRAHDPDGRLDRRLVAAARVSARLQHPNVCPVYHVGHDPAGRPFVVTPPAERTLADAVRADGPHPTRWLPAFEAVCRAVGHAHACGVVHRDLKPQHVLLGPAGHVWVSGWDLARPPGDDPGPAGCVLGTPVYMPPEAAHGFGPSDPRWDVFGLGGILCSVLTGAPPHRTDGGSVRAVLEAAAAGDLSDAHRRLAASRADRRVADLCRRCLAARPEDRPADGGAVAAAVAELIRPGFGVGRVLAAWWRR